MSSQMYFLRSLFNRFYTNHISNVLHKTFVLILDIELWILKFFFGNDDVIRQFVGIIFEGCEGYKRVGQLIPLKDQWIHLLSSLKVASHDLHRKTDITSEEDAWKIQDNLDVFCWKFVEMFGSDAVTNYIWLWMSGVLVPFFVKFGNIRMLQLQVLARLFIFDTGSGYIFKCNSLHYKGFEAKNGHVRFHVLNKTSHKRL